MKKMMYGVLKMKKAIIILTVLFCLLALAGTVSAVEEETQLPVLQDSGPAKTGYVQIFCNAENATAIFTEWVNGFYIHRTVNITNGYVETVVNLAAPIKSINITAPGYMPQNITDFQMPEYHQYVNITVTLVPISPTPVSSLPIVGIVGGFCATLALMFIRRNR